MLKRETNRIRHGPAKLGKLLIVENANALVLDCGAVLLCPAFRFFLQLEKAPFSLALSARVCETRIHPPIWFSVVHCFYHRGPVRFHNIMDIIWAGKSSLL